MEADETTGAEKLRLKIVSGNAAGDTVEVEDEFIIGRQAEGAGSLRNDIEISRRHARISAEPDGSFVVEDLGSTNGTYVNGRRVDAPLRLEVGDRIEVGSSALVVQVGAIQPTPASSDTVAPTSGAGQATEIAAEEAPEAAEEPPAPAEEAAAEPPGEPEPPTEPEAPAEPVPAADEPIAVIEEAAAGGEAAPQAGAPALPPLSLRIEVDAVAGTATVALDEGGDRVSLVHSGGRWRLESL